MALGEIFLAAFLQVLFDRLASPELLKFARREGLRIELDKWSKTLSRIRKVLDDAEEKQHTEGAVKEWLDDLRDLAYDVEDILDEFATEVLRRKLMGKSPTSTLKVRKLASACFTGLTPSVVKINIRLRSNITKITARFNDLVSQKDQLKLNESVDVRSNKRKEIPPSTSVVTEDHVYGREKDADSILQLLLSEKFGDDTLTKVRVIPILGMGGIGKTTLAKLIYNDHKVRSFFDLKAWACVSEDFDVVTITKTILQSVTSENCDGRDLNWLQVKLKEKLHGKRFLVILDDVWNENYNDWIILRAPFEIGAPGSSIVITTRNQGVSSLMGTVKVPAYRLKVLTNDACLSIFAQHALDARDFSAHPNLKDVGEEIVRRCKGLPLAAKTVGGILRTTQYRDEWKKVVNSKIWDIPEERSGIVPALMLSYHNLPSHLKRCFAYCSIFPKDYEFEEKQLILLWMAEGLIQSQQEEKEMEELGMEYFRNLLSRSFFQQSSVDKSRFLMHDLISDLAQSVAGDTCFRMEDRVCSGNQENLSGKARHSSYLGGLYDGNKKFEVFSKFKYLRTFLPLMLPYPGYCYLTFHVPLQLLPKSLWLRVLSLNGYCITEISDKIGDLKHLRYLDLSYTPITSLPESITTLYNLQTLILEKCTYLKRLPLTFENLVNLRHLNILDTYSLEGMPPKICKLTCLRTLSNLIVGEGSCSGIKELGPLSNLRGTLCISGLENVTEPWDAREANLIGKPNLSGLSLEWSEDIDESRELEVLNMLQPHNNLKELTIECYGGIEFPTWLRCPFFPDMVILMIENCEKCTSLPAIGQLPSLKVLLIGGMASVKKVGPEFCGDGSSQPFRSLETLHFKDMKEWENWIPCEEFPKLHELLLGSCPRLLGKLPNHLPLLNKIVIYGCGQLVVSISSFPELCELTIERWKGMTVYGGKVDFNSLYFESLSTISEFTGRIEGFNNDGLKTVENLTISDCEELTCLWSNDVGSLPPLPCLRVLKIDGCPKLVSLVANEVEEQLQPGIPSTLREIEIYNCKALESLPKTMMYHYRCLEYIYLNGCDILTCFAKGQLPPTLKQLKIDNCKNMRILLEDNDTNGCSSSTSLLENLDIWGCPSLESLTSSGVLPATLRQLLVYNCPKLQSIAKGLHHCLFLECIVILNCENLKSLPTGIQNLSHLDRIDICNCPTLDFFTDGELLPANLRVLKISNNEKMQAVPNCIHNLVSLQELEILKCSVVSFPKEGFPTNLTSLKISHLNITQGLFEWGLHKLTSLELLQICGGCSHLVSFPNMKLPATLRRLNISHFLNLEYLSSEGFRNLVSLEELEIGQCEKLTSFPENGLPPSLLKLCIVKCEKFMSFPKNGLPPSLLELYIFKCPLLEECCKKDQGSEWLKIAHIPYVQFDSDCL